LIASSLPARAMILGEGVLGARLRGGAGVQSRAVEDDPHAMLLGQREQR